MALHGTDKYYFGSLFYDLFLTDRVLVENTLIILKGSGDGENIAKEVTKLF